MGGLCLEVHMDRSQEHPLNPMNSIGIGRAWASQGPEGWSTEEDQGAALVMVTVDRDGKEVSMTLVEMINQPSRRKLAANAATKEGKT